MSVISKVDKNPSTAIIIPIRSKMNNKEYCNDCPYCSKEVQENIHTKNFKCVYSTDKRVIRLKVFENEKVEIPFWCPKKKTQKTSMLDEEQQKRWEASRLKYEAEKRWREIAGKIAWADLKEGERYHCPPSPFHGRMDIEIEALYPGSLKARVIDEDRLVWLYKTDESYKFMSLLKSSNHGHH